MLLYERFHVVDLARAFILLRGPPIAREQNDCWIALCRTRIDIIKLLIAKSRILQKVWNKRTRSIHEIYRQFTIVIPYL